MSTSTDTVAPGGYPPFELTERVERQLGDPTDPGQVFSFAACADLDAREAFPADICHRLDDLGLPAYYVPVAAGGELGDHTDLLQLIRLLSRRDFTVALAHAKTYLGAVCVWVGGGQAQASRLGTRITSGAVVSLALTERDHGSDVLAGELTATRLSAGAGFRLTGEKWLINNATRADLVCVLARTDPAGGPRGFSLLLVDKHALPAGSHRPLPKVRTHGVRGADISGIAFDNPGIPADVPAATLVGAEGAGLEIVLKGFQITRTLCAGMSLGMADHALRITTEFAAGHRMYQRSLLDLPHARRTLAEAYADLLTVEAVSLLATRSIHALPADLSVVSAVVKYLVPTTVERTIAALGQVLGARSLLTAAHADGRFQKLERDHRIVGIFDGSTVVNLNALVNQFAGMARGYRTGRVDRPGLTAAAALADPPPTLEPDRLSLVARDGCSIMQDLPDAVAELAAVAPDDVVRQAARIHHIADDLHADLAAYRPTARDVPPAAFELARRYALCFAAAACIRLWLANRSWAAGAGPWSDGLWLRVALDRLLRGLTPGQAETGECDTGYDRLADDLCARFAAGELFSLLPCRLAEVRRA
jgi:alkylation response protein AidB-like acyl-CoA dehydrogenase